MSQVNDDGRTDDRIVHLSLRLRCTKKTTRMTGFKLMHVSSAIHQYVAVNICSEGGFRHKKALPLPIFVPPWIHPLEYLAKTTTRMAAFQVKPFVFEALFDSFLPPQGGSDKKPKHMCGSWELHPYQVSSTSIKQFCSKGWLCEFPYIYIHALVHTPFLHLNKYIKSH